MKYILLFIILVTSCSEINDNINNYEIPYIYYETNRIYRTYCENIIITNEYNQYRYEYKYFNKYYCSQVLKVIQYKNRKEYILIDIIQE